MRVIIAAAGTGGHINPGIAIANKIKEEEPDSKIIFIGTTRGLENDLVPRAGYELKTIDAYGLSKKINMQNIEKMFKTLHGFEQARKIVKEFKPDLVVGTGGYIGGAVITAAVKYKVPTLLHESNAFPGKAIKFLFNKVDRVLVGFEDAKKRLPNSDKVIVTGTPVKMKYKEYTKKEIDDLKISMKLDTNKPIVLVFGGSQGAKAINDTMITIVKNRVKKLKEVESNPSIQLTLKDEYQIIWAAGPIQYDNIKRELKNSSININNIKGIQILPYIYNMDEVMHIVDIMVCRSGAMTINEICIVGKPAIYIPLPTAAENHQEFNARVLEKIDAAKIILNKDLKNYRDELIISSKAGYDMWPGPYGDHGSRKYLVASLDQSLKRMGLDYVDIFYHHRPDPETPIEETMTALDHIVRQGKALYVGLSNYNAKQTEEAVKILKELGTPCLIHQASYSMFNRWIENGLQDVLKEEGVGTIAFMPLQQGLLTNKYLKEIPKDSRAASSSKFLHESDITEEKINKVRELNEIALERGQSLAQMALAWVLREGRVTSALIGASRPSQIIENVQAINNIEFSKEELELIEKILK